MVATQGIWACRRGEDSSLKFKASIRMRKKGDWRDFEHGEHGGWLFGAAGLINSQTAGDLLGFPQHHKHLQFTENGPKYCTYIFIKPNTLHELHALFCLCDSRNPHCSPLVSFVIAYRVEWRLCQLSHVQPFSKSAPTCVLYSKVTSGLLIKYMTCHPHPASGRAHNVSLQRSLSFAL